MEGFTWISDVARGWVLVFDDRQLITGLSGTMFEGLWHTQNLTVNARDKRFMLVRALLSSNSLYVQSACSILCWIDWYDC